jgi:hypothetical protein
MRSLRSEIQDEGLVHGRMKEVLSHLDDGYAQESERDAVSASELEATRLRNRLHTARKVTASKLRLVQLSARMSNTSSI